MAVAACFWVTAFFSFVGSLRKGMLLLLLSLFLLLPREEEGNFKAARIHIV